MTLGEINDSVIELRISDIDAVTEDLISDIISEEFEGLVKEYNATTRTPTKCGANTARRLSAISFAKGSDGRQSVLSVRTSLMSLSLSDKFLEQIMNRTSDGSLKSCESLLRKPRASENTNVDLYEDACRDNFSDVSFAVSSMSSVTPSSNIFSGVPMESQHEPLTICGDDPRRKIPIMSDPLVLGGGGILGHMDANRGENQEKSMKLFVDPSILEKMEDQNSNNNSDSNSTGPSPCKRPFPMRFSISRSTLDMLDEDFSDVPTFFPDHDNAEPRKSVNAVSNEMRQTYLNETEQIYKVQEDALAREIEKLSFDDKAKVDFEVHGIPHMGNLYQQPVNIDWYLQQLEIELQSTTQYSDAFREAQRMNPNYVNSKEFRLMFLRIFLQKNSFDVKQAAAKMILYFSTKKLIFGSGEILGRDIRLSDLSVDDRAAMDSGAWQTMSDRDVAGRVVVFYAPGQRVFKTVENWMRALWYMLYLSAKDEDNQKSGMVVVLYLEGFTNKRDTFEQAKKITMVRDAIPQNFVAFHYCYNDESMKAFVTAQKIHFLTRNHRSHTRDHLASHNEICFRLETYGIYVDKNILLENGHLGMMCYNQWIQWRETAEAETVGRDSNAATNTIETTIVPKKYDVLFGRGRNTREHCGNLRCALLVEIHQQEYENHNKTEKTVLAERIINMVKECGGKFLKKDRKHGWQEVPDNKAREKVAHFFRHLRAVNPVNDKTKDNASNKPGLNEPSQKRTLPC